MKLRNKRTGEIIILIDHIFDNYNSLAELNEEWEDYQEPKEYWFIRDCSSIRGDTKGIGYSPESNNDTARYRKEIGNYFETQEEAEKAVEKLKALAKLKQYGFRFIDWELDMKTVADGKIWFDIGLNTEWNAEQLLKLNTEVKESLDLLLGGEDESSN